MTTATNEGSRQVHSLEMACSCNDNKAHCLERRDKASKALRLSDVHRENYVSQLIYSLGHEFTDYYSITSVHVDMWMRVTVESETKRISCTCDLVEDGLTSIVLWLIDQGEQVDDDV